MRISLFHRGSFWSVWSVLANNGGDPIAGLPPANYSIAVARIQRFSDHEAGPEIYPKNICHKVGGIYQLNVGGGVYRLPFFSQPGKIIVITHVREKLGGKQANKTPSDEIKKAKQIRAAFDQAVADGTLIREE